MTDGGRHGDLTYRSAARHRAATPRKYGFSYLTFPWQKELFRPKWRNCMSRDSTMKTMSAREAKNGFGLMIDTARAAPVLIEKHGRGVVIVMSVEEYERLSQLADGATKEKGKVVEVSKRV